MSAALPKAFGNYALAGIEEIALPPAVSWFPQTVAWLILALFLVLLLGVCSFRWWRRYQRDRYRREALNQLASWVEQEQWGETVQRLPALLRAVALQTYSRELVVSLTGKRWLAFLAQRCPESNLQSPVGEQLLELAYQPESSIALSADAAARLIEQCRVWIRHHRVDH